jgi:hypothetical protein
MQRKRMVYSTEIGGMYTSSFYTVWREEAAGQGRKGGGWRQLCRQSAGGVGEEVR